MDTLDSRDVILIPTYELDEDFDELTEPDAPVYWNTERRG